MYIYNTENIHIYIYINIHIYTYTVGICKKLILQFISEFIFYFKYIPPQKKNFPLPQAVKKLPSFSLHKQVCARYIIKR